MKPPSRRQRIAWWLQDLVGDPLFLSLGIVLALGVALGGIIAWSLLAFGIGFGAFLLGLFIFWLGEIGQP